MRSRSVAVIAAERQKTEGNGRQTTSERRSLTEGSFVALMGKNFANDLLRGAEEIAEFLYGDRRLRRRVYHLVATSRLPVFRLGSLICARRSQLVHWVEEMEGRSWRDRP